MNIVILTEEGKNIGLGHISRCMAIYHQLKKEGHNVSILLYQNESNLKFGNVNCVNWLSMDPENFLSNEEVVVIDSYLVTYDWLLKLKKLNKKLIQIDDYNRIEYPVDIIINPNAFAKEEDYKNQNAIFKGGPDYIIIREEFKTNQIVSKKSELTLFITLGGCDYRNLLNKLCSWGKSLDLYKIRVVVTDENMLFDENIKILPMLDAKKMAFEMRSAHVVISGCGQTLNELYYINKPTIGICIDHDQEPNCSYYNKIGFLKENLNWDDNKLKSKVVKQLIEYSNLKERNKQIKAFEKINSDGIINVTKAITQDL